MTNNNLKNPQNLNQQDDLQYQTYNSHANGTSMQAASGGADGTIITGTYKHHNTITTAGAGAGAALSESPLPDLFYLAPQL